MKDLDHLVEPESRGDSENPLRWTTKSTIKLAETLQKKGYSITQPVVWSLLKKLGYSLQSNKKTEEGVSHPDRDQQFRFINKKGNYPASKIGSLVFLAKREAKASDADMPFFLQVER